MELARAGDHRAFEVIIERYRPALVAHCRAIVGDTAAQDAVQQASISAWQALRRDQHVRHVRAWLHTIARRAALESLQGQDAMPAGLPDTLSRSVSPEELIERSDRARATLAAVAELPARERDALLWTSLHGRSGREAARALGVSEGAIRQLVVRARARARAALPVFAPPALLARLPVLHAPRRLVAIVERLPGGLGSAPGGEAFGWLAPVLAAGALVAAPLAAVNLAAHHATGRPARVTAAANATAPEPSAARTGARERKRGPADRAAATRETHPRAPSREASKAPATDGGRTRASQGSGAGGPSAPSGEEGAQRADAHVPALDAARQQPPLSPPSMPATPATPSIPSGEAPVGETVTGLTEQVGVVAEAAGDATRTLRSDAEGAAQRTLEHAPLP